jgi:hypothetical protein
MDLLTRLARLSMDLLMGVVSETVIPNGLGAPIRMVSFPSMETRQSIPVTSQPDIAGPQIEIPVANDADKFNTIPDVAVRNHYWLNRCRSHYHRCRDDDWQR